MTFLKAVVLPILLGTVLVVAEDKKLFHGDKVIRVLPTTMQHHDWLAELHVNADPNVHDFWSHPAGPNKLVDIHVNKDALDEFYGHLAAMKLNFTVGIEDLQKLIDKVDAPMIRRQRREAKLVEQGKLGSREATSRILNTYPVYDKIVEWVNSMCDTYPDLATCGSLGKTFEGRELQYIKIGAKSSTKKWQIFLEAGIHSREWIAPATTIYIVNRLLTTYTTDPTAKRMLDTFDFMVVPSANPDGYEYSRKDRMWRKNRSKLTPTATCVGVDPNRNYDTNWASSGSSSSPCSDIYHGPKAFSELNTQALSNYISTNKDSILAFFAIHCFQQQWLIPYADKRNHKPADFDELLRVANIGVKALTAVNNKKWQAGNTVDILSAAAGGSDDWAKQIGIKYAYTLELRPAGSTFNGFVIAESEIEPSGREVYAGLVAALDAMQK